VKRLAIAAVFGCCLLGWQGQAVAAPGDVDPSFGAGGVVETPQALTQDHFREIPLGIAIGPHDEIFTLGAVPRACRLECLLDLEVTRYGRDGSRDTSFGSAGRTVLTVRPGQDLRVAASIAVGGDSKVLVATTNESDITLLRLTSGGAIDPTFGGTGIVSSHFSGRDQAAGIAVQRDGAIVVAGAWETLLEGTQPLLLRYTPAGTLDSGFGEGGLRVLGFAPGNYPAGLALPGQGRVAVGLSDCCYAIGRALVARLSADGALDRGFSRQGWRSVGRLAPARVIAVMPARKGRLLVVGGYRNGGRRHRTTVFAARFLSDGRSDMRFGKRGVVWPQLPLPPREVSSSAVDRAGRPLFATTVRSSDEFGLSRLRSDGRLDLTFAGGNAGGIPGLIRAQSVALQSNGRIVVFGEGGACRRVCVPSRMVIARYLGGDSGARCARQRANVVGTRRPETLEGTVGRDVIQALGGNDLIFGFGGNDLICGGSGDDRLVGGPGHDRLIR
jgi:uncharacterized delta-60 repeat protein